MLALLENSTACGVLYEAVRLHTHTHPHTQASLAFHMLCEQARILEPLGPNHPAMS
jgi:hypothetical protein